MGIFDFYRKTLQERRLMKKNKTISELRIANSGLSRTLNRNRNLLANKRITVTGGKGFLGAHLINSLQKHGCRQISIADLPEYNLIRSGDIKKMLRETRPDILIHLAAKVGGIGFNRDNPASLFYEN